ncbi:MAG: hypothetical protein ACI4KJ_05790, partial [Anaerovoracaceae bacterium]
MKSTNICSYFVQKFSHDPILPVDSPLKVRAYHHPERFRRRIYNMNETAIRACGLTKAFGDRTVVSDLSFEV